MALLLRAQCSGGIFPSSPALESAYVRHTEVEHFEVLLAVVIRDAVHAPGLIERPYRAMTVLLVALGVDDKLHRHTITDYESRTDNELRTDRGSRARLQKRKGKG